MCDSDADKDEKWTCDYCTYENFPSSIKCTMCKGSKPHVNENIFQLSPPESDFEERGAAAEVAAKRSNLSTSYDRQDENETASTITTTITTSTTTVATNTPSSTTTTTTMTSGRGGEKWSCKMCTYLNWPRSQRCVQCCTKRGSLSLDIISCSTAEEAGAIVAHSSTAAVAAKLEEKLMPPPERDYVRRHLEKMRITNTTAAASPSPSDTELNASNILESSKYGGATANRLSPSDQPNNAANVTTNQQQQQQQHQQQQSTSTAPQQHPPPQNYFTKWACNTCTYENWPKSLKCSMCGEARGETSSGTPTALGENESLSAAQGNNKFFSVRAESQDTVSTNNSVNMKHIYQLGSSETINNCDTVQERQERRQRQIRRQVDWQWLNACVGVVENNYGAVEAYLSCGGNPARSLTATEIAALNRNSAFDVGHSLIHLAIRFHREEMLPMLLAQITSSGPGIKRVPSYVAPDLAADIRRHFANTLRLRKSVFSCHYVQEHATFSLPADIEELPTPIQEQLYDELLDRDAQKQLECKPPALNWSLEITARLGSRLLVLWNRSAGDCLLDSAMQATWGVFDRDNILRQALSDSLHQCSHIFYSRWKEYEMFQASMLHFTLEETQWQEDWSSLLTLASQPGSSLEQLHIFALAHILRRPIIVYGVKYVKSFRGEDIGYARFEGVYLPFFWDQNFCIKSPIALGYTRGHFSALVPMEPYARIDTRREEPENVTYLPLMDCESKLLPIHFLAQAEMGRDEAIMRQWLDVCVTEGGLLVAQQKLRKRPLLVAQMLEEWLNHYRRIAQVITAPFLRRPQQTGYSSEGDSDEE